MSKTKDSVSAETKGALEAKRDALMDAEAKDSPVLSLIMKRLRAARKKVKKVEEIEAIKAGGREINTDQASQSPIGNLKRCKRLLRYHKACLLSMKC